MTKLRGHVASAKSNNPLTPVTIIVRDNIAAISTRRALARGVGGRTGIAAINVTTLRRLAEQILAGAGRTLPPVTSALLTALWRRELAREPGCFEPVIEHAATVRALVRAHGELRELKAAELEVVAGSGELGVDLVRLHRAVAGEALRGRRDEVAVLTDATALVESGDASIDGLGPIIMHQPEEPSPAEAAFLAALEAAGDVTVLIGETGVDAVDGPLFAAFGASSRFARSATGGTGGGGASSRFARSATGGEATASRIVHASDSDDEVRAIVREVRGLLAGGVRAHRVAVLHSTAQPYARLVHDHLRGAGIVTNGPGVRPLRDRAIADGFLALLALDPDDLQRVAFFDWLGRAPIRLGEGNTAVPRTRWERLSRDAGIVGGDWATRLADYEARHQARLDADRDDPDTSDRSIAYRERSIAETQALASFVSELRQRLTEGRELTGWAALGEWAAGMLHRYIGRSDTLSRLPDDEQRAATAIETTLGSLAELDALGDRPTLRELIEILDVDLDARRPRVGRFGDGVFVGPIGSAASLDVDHVFVLGLSEDLYPGRRSVDPLLPESVRAATGGALRTAADQLRRQHRAVLDAFAAGTDVTASFPRGDLRRGAERLPSRWLMPSLRALTGQPDLEATRWHEASSPHLHSVASHWEGIARTPSPGTAQEWRLRTLTSGTELAGDAALDAALALIHARREPAFTRFDGNLTGIPDLPDYAAGEAPISPTALERYAGCPHAFFVERLLGVKPLDTPEEIISLRPMDLGSIVHNVLDILTTREQDDLPDYGQPWTPAQRDHMRRIAEEVMTDFEQRGLTGHPRLWEREQAQLRHDLEAVLDLDDAAHRERDARIQASELTFGMHGRPPVRIDLDEGHLSMRGSADRVDITRDGRLIVSDFKTGTSGSSFQEIKKDPVAAGKKLQLPLYAHAARDAFGDVPVEAGYWFIGRRNRGDRVKVELDAQVETIYRAALTTLTAGIRDGHFLPRPPATDDFAWVQCPYCNPDGVGYGHVRAPAERKRTDAALAGLFALLDPSVLEAGEEDA